MKYLFGPVPSRRLGLSLGVDLVPAKTCTFDCLYCEVGPTTSLTCRRLAYQVPEIQAELAAYLQEGGSRPDVITLAGSGEPTLNAGLGEIIGKIKELTQIPVAVLTNGALCCRGEVRRELAGADLILPSLDAAREETFQRINRPAPGLTLQMIVEGLKDLRREYAGQIWLEVMVLRGLNDQEEELAPLRQVIRGLAPDKIQLNTAVRPVVDDLAQPLNEVEMAQVAAYLGNGAEVIAACRRHAGESAVTDDVLLAALARRPMTARDLAQALGMRLVAVQKYLDRLEEAGLVHLDQYHKEGFYRSASGAHH
jgi:wyosine [tRNA(Phe)-imidazoG37] synthetase (radical SAM superfamily)